MAGRLARVVLCMVAVTVTSPVPARAACPDAPILHPFAQWGDDGDYVGVPGGTFEPALTWTATGSAALVAEDDPFDVAGDGMSSVRLGTGDSVTSPVLCVSKNHPHMRFLARAADGKSHLRIEVLYSDAKSKERVVALAEQPGERYPQWSPSGDVMLKKALPPKIEDARDVRLRFSVRDRSGEWLVDDVFVDPHKRA